MKAHTPQPSLSALWNPVDILSLVFFRIAFGAIAVWGVIRYFAGDRISRYYVEPDFFFTYYGFSWVRAWPEPWIQIHFVVLGLLGLCILLGLFYRLSTLLYFVGFTYVFLLDQSHYLNHYYLVSLISFLMIFIPAHQSLSLDALRVPALHSMTVPNGSIWLLRAQIGLVYFFGGVAKLNGDWLRGEPIRAWLAKRTDIPLIGGLMDEAWLVWVFAYGGLLFDLLIIPALLWRRTRLWAFGVAVMFHLTNSIVFNIGIFPWFMIAATTLFLEPDWPRRLFPRWQALAAPRNAFRPQKKPADPTTRKAVLILAGTYLAIQLLVPWRHLLYPGNVAWNEQGHRFSWRMKLRSKQGTAQFFVTDGATGQTSKVDPAKYLDYAQYQEMLPRPDMILQFAHRLAAERYSRGSTNVQVRAFVKVSLNGRAPHLLVDPSVNLAAQPRTLRPPTWILPLGEPLRRPDNSAR